LAAGDDVHWMHGWLVVGPQCIAVAAADEVEGSVPLGGIPS